MAQHVFRQPHRNLLLMLAWQSVAEGLKKGKPLAIELEQYPALFRDPCGNFVTLSYKGHPRGCVGRLECARSLAEDICENAFSAAFHDKNFPTVADAEISDLHVQIHLVDSLETLSLSSDLDLISLLRPNIDGLQIEHGPRHAVLLPASWAQLSSPLQFVQQLKQKAGIPSTYWSRSITIKRFTTLHFGDK